MTPSRAELLRRRRCLGLRIAVVFGVLLIAFTRDWAIAGVVLAGIAVAVAVYWRLCRHTPGAIRHTPARPRRLR